MSIKKLGWILLTTTTALMIFAACGTEEGDSGPASPAPVAPEQAQGNGGDGTDSLSLTRSGSRIKAKVVRGADGTKEFLGWNDSVLNIDCSFRRAGDGVIRCLPRLSSVTGYAFSDPECKVPLFETFVAPRPGCPEPAQVFVARRADKLICSDDEAIRYHVHALKKHTGKVYRASYDKRCNEEPLSDKFYEIGDEVDASQFQEAAIELE